MSKTTIMNKPADIAALVNGIGHDDTFIEDLEQFFFERHGNRQMTDREAELCREAISIEQALTELLKDNNEASKLFRDFDDNRNEAMGWSNDSRYERGFFDGIKFMMVAMERGEQ